MNKYGGLEEGFGGLFEVLTFQDDKLAKIDDVLYCFWTIDEHSEREIIISPNTPFVKIKYQDDILVVRRSDFVHNQQMINDGFIIGPMAKPVPAAELQMIPTPDLNSVHDCHYVAVLSGDAYEVLALVNLFRKGRSGSFSRSG